MKIRQSEEVPLCSQPAGRLQTFSVPFRKPMLSRPQKNLRCTFSPNHTYLDSKERLAVVEAAQSCRECVEGTAFFRHLSVSVPGPHTFFRVKRKGAQGISPSPSAAAVLREPARTLAAWLGE